MKGRKSDIAFLAVFSFTMVANIVTLAIQQHNRVNEIKEVVKVGEVVEETVEPLSCKCSCEVYETTVENSVENVESIIEEEISEVPVIEEQVSKEVHTIPVQEDEAVGVLKRSNLTAEELRTVLLYDLKDYSEYFIEAERTTGVNAVFLASIAALESGWARSDVAKEKNNIFGWIGSDGYMRFNSVRECILFVADCLKSNYLSEDGIWFEGYEVADVNIHYNGSKFWEDNVTDIMESIIERIERGE